MNKILIIAALLASSSAFAADSTSTSVGKSATADASANSGSVSGASNLGNSQSITFTSPPETKSTISQTVNGSQIVSGETTQNVNYGTQTIKNTPSVSGPNLTSSNDTCMGSASGSANVPGIGISFGKTYTDENCVMLKNSRELWNMGMKAASMALMCMDKNNRAALEMTGFTCPQSQK